MAAKNPDTSKHNTCLKDFLVRLRDDGLPAQDVGLSPLPNVVLSAEDRRAKGRVRMQARRAADKGRQAVDPAYVEVRATARDAANALRRERYANEPEYRARQIATKQASIARNPDAAKEHARASQARVKARKLEDPEFDQAVREKNNARMKIYLCASRNVERQTRSTLSYGNATQQTPTSEVIEGATQTNTLPRAPRVNWRRTTHTCEPTTRRGAQSISSSASQAACVHVFE